MEFAVLGSLQVLGEKGEIAIGGAKERTALANLVARAGHSVPAVQLIDNPWGEEPPRTAHKSVQNLVLRLRKTLEPDWEGGPRLVVTYDGGYRLAVSEERASTRTASPASRRKPGAGSGRGGRTSPRRG